MYISWLFGSCSLRLMVDGWKWLQRKYCAKNLTLIDLVASRLPWFSIFCLQVLANYLPSSSTTWIIWHKPEKDKHLLPSKSFFQKAQLLLTSQPFKLAPQHCNKRIKEVLLIIWGIYVHFLWQQVAARRYVRNNSPYQQTSSIFMGRN